MGFSEYDRIRKKNIIYNYPNADTNFKARRVINKCKSSGMSNKEVQNLLCDELESTNKDTAHAEVLKTALFILKR